MVFCGWVNSEVVVQRALNYEHLPLCNNPPAFLLITAHLWALNVLPGTDL